MKITTCLLALLLSLSANVFAGAPKVKNQTDYWRYSVQKNDSFERICQKYLNKSANIAALSALNPHKLTRKLQPGQVIVIPVAMLKTTPTAVKVSVVYGFVVALTRKNGQHKVSQGDTLAQGDIVQTAKNSLVKLLFADGSITEVQSNSSLTIQSSFQYVGKQTYVTHLELAQGRTETKANPNHTVGNTMKIETPSAIAAVRGTQFRVGAEDDIALQETLEGQVAFSASGKKTLLAKGYGSIAEKGKSPLPPILLPAAPDVSALPKLVQKGATVEFTLAQQADAKAWVSQLALDAGFTKIVNEQSLQSTRLVLPYLAEGQYYLKLRAKDAHGLQSADAAHAFSVVKVLPPPSALIAPEDGAVIPVAPISFSWTPVPEATSYTVQVARNASFEYVIYESPISLNSNTSINQTFGAGEFYWRVAILSHGKPQSFSDVRKFSR